VTFSLLFSLLSLFVLPILGLFTLFLLRKVLHLRLWFIAILGCGFGLLLSFCPSIVHSRFGDLVGYDCSS